MYVVVVKYWNYRAGCPSVDIFVYSLQKDAIDKLTLIHNESCSEYTINFTTNDLNCESCTVLNLGNGQYEFATQDNTKQAEIIHLNKNSDNSFELKDVRLELDFP